MTPPPPIGAARYLGTGLQFAVTLLAGLYLGYIFDSKFGTLPWGTLGGSAMGFAAGFYGLWSELMRKDHDKGPS